MASIANEVLDTSLQYLIDNVDNLYICSQEPTNYTEAITTYALGTKASPTIGSIADGDTSGRKVTCSAFTDGSVSSSGTATHVAWVDSVNTNLLYTVALTSSQVVTNGNSFSLDAHKYEIRDPT